MRFLPTLFFCLILSIGTVQSTCPSNCSDFLLNCNSNCSSQTCGLSAWPQAYYTQSNDNKPIIKLCDQMIIPVYETCEPQVSESNTVVVNGKTCLDTYVFQAKQGVTYEVEAAGTTGRVDFSVSGAVCRSTCPYGYGGGYSLPCQCEALNTGAVIICTSSYYSSSTADWKYLVTPCPPDATVIGFRPYIPLKGSVSGRSVSESEGRYIIEIDYADLRIINYTYPATIYYQCFYKGPTLGKVFLPGSSGNISYKGYGQSLQTLNFYWRYDNVTRQMVTGQDIIEVGNGNVSCDGRLIPFSVNSTLSQFQPVEFFHGHLYHRPVCQLSDWSDWQPCPQKCLRAGDPVPAVARWRGPYDATTRAFFGYLYQQYVAVSEPYFNQNGVPRCSFDSKSFDFNPYEDSFEWNTSVCAKVPLCDSSVPPKADGLWSNPITFDCNGQLYLGNARVGVELQSLVAFIDKVGDYAKQTQGECHCNATSQQSEDLFGWDIKHVLKAIEWSTTQADYPDLPCLQDMRFSWKKLNEWFGLQLHPECSYSSWTAGKGCQMRFAFPDTSMEAVVSIDKCPNGRKLPFIQLNLTGGPMDDFWLPCNNDTDCISNTCDYVEYPSYVDNFDLYKTLLHDLLQWDKNDGPTGTRADNTTFDVSSLVLTRMLSWVRTVFFGVVGSIPVSARPLKFCGINHWLGPLVGVTDGYWYQPEKPTGHDPLGRLNQTLRPEFWFNNSLQSTANNVLEVDEFGSPDCSSANSGSRLCVKLLSLVGNSNGNVVDANQKTSKFRPKISTLKDTIPDYTKNGVVPLVIFKTDCHGAFVIFPTTPSQSFSGYVTIESLSRTIAETLYDLANARRHMDGKASLSIKDFATLQIPNPGLVLAIIADDGSQFVAPDNISSVYSEVLKWWTSDVEIDGWSGNKSFNMPATCNYSTWRDTGKCALKWDGLGTLFGRGAKKLDLSLLFEMTSCEDLSGYPSLTVSCLGPACATVFEVLDNDLCTQASGCGEGEICQEPPEFLPLFAANWDYPVEIDAGRRYQEISCTGYDVSKLAQAKAEYGSLYNLVRNLTEANRRKWGLLKSYPYEFTVQEAEAAGLFVITVIPQNIICDENTPYSEHCGDMVQCYRTGYCATEQCGPLGTGQNGCVPLNGAYAYQVSRSDEEACFHDWRKWGSPNCTQYDGTQVNGYRTNGCFQENVDEHGAELWIPFSDCPIAKFTFAFVETGLLKPLLGASTYCTALQEKPKLSACADKQFRMDCNAAGGPGVDECANTKRTQIEWMNMFRELNGKSTLDLSEAMNNPMNGFCFIDVDIRAATKYVENTLKVTKYYDPENSTVQIGQMMEITDLHCWPPCGGENNGNGGTYPPSNNGSGGTQAPSNGGTQAPSNGGGGTQAPSNNGGGGTQAPSNNGGGGTQAPIIEVNACTSTSCTGDRSCEDVRYPTSGWDRADGFNCICPVGQSCEPLTCSSLHRNGTNTSSGCGDCISNFVAPLNSPSDTKCMRDDPNGCNDPNACTAPLVCFDCRYNDATGTTANCLPGKNYWDPTARNCSCPVNQPNCMNTNTGTDTTDYSLLCSKLDRVVNKDNSGAAGQTDVTSNGKLTCFPPVKGCGCCVGGYKEDVAGKNACQATSNGSAQLVPSLAVLFAGALALFLA
eukprot:gb/GEZN01000256.1/.p1 GENE.gb/GEZN01000256.1/~~gb/GEZN01000256.1/.p1  ORF type:complete len:1636 (+),score=149.47 gb/GEZN01000256.1/:13-4920(+)